MEAPTAIKPDVPRVIGVVGAGTMGSGIAQLALLCDAETVLLADPSEVARHRARATVEQGIERLVARGTLDPADARQALGRLQLAAGADDLASCGLVIEAVPEQLELKRTVFAQVAAVTAPDCVLATNTSSLSVTAIAAGVPRPERVVGMHFFNPAPVMRLVEVVAGEATGALALTLARVVAERMGKRVVRAADGPGFIVNRCNRPFSLEALRLVQERIATPQQIDRICRLGAGFPMGPFELMDLVGIDVGFAVSQSFFEQSFGEPRWQPSPLVARKVAAGHHGRKSGRGWYAYPGGGRSRTEDPAPPPVGGGEGLVIVGGETPLAAEILEAAEQAGWDAVLPEESEGAVPALIVDCGAAPGGPPLQGGPQVLLCDQAPLAALDPQGSSAGFYAQAPFGAAQLVELTQQPGTPAATINAAERFFASLGKHVEWVGDAPGLVLGRIVCQLVNEAAFALGEGIGTADDIDAGMVLGLNHPRGPLEWGDAIGAPDVLGVLLGLWEEFREPRYRPAPALMQAVRTGEPLSG
jgi:3-hydroxybutyryl-CoA dehydrogenase